MLPMMLMAMIKTLASEIWWVNIIQCHYDTEQSPPFVYPEVGKTLGKHHPKLVKVIVAFADFINREFG